MTAIPCDPPISPEGEISRRSDFAPLVQLVRNHGLLHTSRVRQVVYISLDLAALIAAWDGVFILRRSWWALMLAIPVALFTTRIIFVGHDVGHRQVACTARVNNLMGLIVGDLLTGVGSRWWIDKHSRHHANPNQVGKDPDVDPGALVWTREQAADRHSQVGVWLARHQAQLYFPMLLLEALNLKVTSIRAARSARDLALACAHVGIYVGGLVLMIGPGKAAVFIAIHQALVGAHLGIAFAPNHKGMPMPEPGARQDFLRKQVLTSRNISGGRVMDWLLGGLNHQIEHHLFPSMPRHNLRRARGIVQSHCADLQVPYTQASLRVSMILTLRHLRDVAAGTGS